MTDNLRERIARIIDPSSWRVMDGYLEQTKRKHKGQNVSWPVDQFQHKESLAIADAVLAELRKDAVADAETTWNTWNGPGIPHERDKQAFMAGYRAAHPPVPPVQIIDEASDITPEIMQYVVDRTATQRT